MPEKTHNNVVLDDIAFYSPTCADELMREIDEGLNRHDVKVRPLKYADRLKALIRRLEEKVGQAGG